VGDGSNVGKMGLALGGGGARGLAHIGVLKVLEREKIPIDFLSGTSMGGVIGALYASGTATVDEIEAEALRVGKLRELVRLIDVGLQQAGIVKGARIYEYLTERLGANLSFVDLGVPLALVAVDTVTGKQVILSEGSLIDAIRATISVPGVFVPVEAGDQRLVDGGILNNVPADVARDLGAEVVIAVDVMHYYRQHPSGGAHFSSPLGIPYAPRYLEELWTAQMIMISALTEQNLRISRPEVLICPDLPDDITLFSGFNRAEEAIAAGEAAAEAAVPQLGRLVGRV
jgi:NTE family protein